MMKNYFIYISLLIFLTIPGCTSHKVEVAPVEIKPIHITIDVNIKVDRALDDFFGDIDETAETIDETSATTE